MSRLDEFRNMIDVIEDKQVLESGQALLKDMIAIASLKRRAKELEEALVEDGKAIFYFFAEELDEDEILFAAERISGRLKRLDWKQKRDKKSCDE